MKKETYENGVLIESIDISEEIPDEVTPMSLLLALESMNLLTAVETFIETRTKAEKLAWQRASVYKRDNPLLNHGATLMGLSSEDIDNLFKLAKSIESSN